MNDKRKADRNFTILQKKYEKLVQLPAITKFDGPTELFPELQKFNKSQVEFPHQGNARVILGEGTFARVVLGYLRPLSCLVAVKQLKPTPNSDHMRAAKNSLMNEAKVSALLTESNSGVFLYGIVSETEAVYQLLNLPPFNSTVSLKDGRSVCVSFNPATLHRFMRSAGAKDLLQAKDWLNLCKDLCDGLQQLHFHGITHNDIKTNNVLVEVPLAGVQNSVTIGVCRPVAKLSDFGLATSVSKKIRWRVSKVKEFYAPELRRSTPGLLSKRSDAYSLGYVFSKIHKCCSVKLLGDLAQQLMATNPSDRREIGQVNNDLTAALLKL